ncbi:MAG TPA: hypothetical protein VK628_05070 [Flavitalea sp.]|nr:hypothetical protein [Flavitalea sp.]
MALNIVIPKLNPVDFYLSDYAPPPQYGTPFMDDVPFVQQVRSYQLKKNYCQKWTVHDVINLQFEANAAPIQIDIRDCSGTSVNAVNAVQRRKNKYIDNYSVYEATLPLTGIAPGNYYLTLKVQNTELFSEPFQVFATLPNSVLIEYNNSRYKGDVVFETGIRFSFRVEALITEFSPGNERVAYRDQRLNPTILSSRPFRSWNLVVGFNYGVPDWVGEMINHIFSCDNVAIDGVTYSVLEDSKIEVTERDPQYPMKTFSVQILEGYNRSSKTFGIEMDANNRILTGSPISRDIFGDLVGGGSVIVIQSYD